MSEAASAVDKELWTNLGVGIGLIASIIAATMLRKTRIGFLKWWEKWIKQHVALSRRGMESYSKLNALLAELRVEMDADRAYVLQFHNGHEFSISQPIWRMSCTHEICAPGISYEAESMQNILVSTVVEGIIPFFPGDDVKLSGIVPVDCDNCLGKCKSTVRRTHWCTVTELPPSRLKQRLVSQGIKNWLCTNLFSAGGHVIGIMGVDYCLDIDTAAFAERVQILCHKAEQVQFLLMGRKQK